LAIRTWRLVIPALAPDTCTPMRRDWNLAPNSWLNLSMYGSLFVRKYRQKYRRLRTRLYRQLHRSLYLDLNLNLNLNLNPLLYRAFFAKSYKS
jgi:hypothetical protein